MALTLHMLVLVIYVDRYANLVTIVLYTTMLFGNKQSNCCGVLLCVLFNLSLKASASV